MSPARKAQWDDRLARLRVHVARLAESGDYAGSHRAAAVLSRAVRLWGWEVFFARRISPCA